MGFNIQDALNQFKQGMQSATNAVRNGASYDEIRNSILGIQGGPSGQAPTRGVPAAPPNAEAQRADAEEAFDAKTDDDKGYAEGEDEKGKRGDRPTVMTPNEANLEFAASDPNAMAMPTGYTMDALMPSKSGSSDSSSSSGSNGSDWAEAKNRENEFAAADPNAMAMPTGYTMDTLTPEEREKWQSTNQELYADLMLQLATLPIGGLLGSAVKGASMAGRGAKAADAVADALGAGKAASGLDKAVVDKAISEADPAIKNVVNNIVNGVNKELGTDAFYSREAIMNALKAGEAVAPKTAAASLAEDVAPGMIQGLLPAGVALTGMLTSETAHGAHDSDETAAKKAEEKAAAAEKAGAGGTYAPKSQRQEYLEFLETPAGQAWLDAHGRGIYDDADYGYENLRASRDMDAWGDLLGYNPDAEGINSWRGRYGAAGVNLDDLASLEEYLYGPEALSQSAFDMALAGKGDFDVSKFGRGDDFENMAKYMLTNSDYGPELIAALNNQGLDENDFAALALGVAASNGNLNISEDDVNRILGAAGEGTEIGLGDDYSMRWDAPNRKYELSDIMNMRNLNKNDVGSYGNVTIDDNLLPYLMAYLDSQQPDGKRYGAKVRS